MFWFVFWRVTLCFFFAVLCPWTADTSKIPKLFWLFLTATVQESVPGGYATKGPWKIMEPLNAGLKRVFRIIKKKTQKARRISRASRF